MLFYKKKLKHANDATSVYMQIRPWQVKHNGMPTVKRNNHADLT